MDSLEMLDFVYDALVETMENDQRIKRVETFEQAGILSSQVGVVVTLKTGGQYQITLVRSR